MMLIDRYGVIENRLVIVLDICSSTTILERLKQRDRVPVWRTFLLALKRAVVREGNLLHMELYNFTGDGWILLFPENTTTDSACQFMKVISQRFIARFQKYVSSFLTVRPDPFGLSFGIDVGSLICIPMNRKIEYLGRAINVACRLQSCTKEFDGGPSYKAVFSTDSFNRHNHPEPSVRAERKLVRLRNVIPETAECFVYQTFTEKANRRSGRSGLG
jgi:class 3 adenylate cyclase